MAEQIDQQRQHHGVAHGCRSGEADEDTVPDIAGGADNREEHHPEQKRKGLADDARLIRKYADQRCAEEPINRADGYGHAHTPEERISDRSFQIAIIFGALVFPHQALRCECKTIDAIRHPV